MKIIPAILVKSETEFLKQTQAIENVTDCVHIDITDGEFVPETTWADPDVVRANLKNDCELHLMVKNPLTVIEKWKDVPQVKRVLFHAEADANHSEVIEVIHAQGWQTTVVLNPETSVEAIESVVQKLDGVMGMTIHPGAQGRAFMPEVLPKLSDLKQNYPHLIVQVDGGVNSATLPLIKGAGIDTACVGSGIFGHGDPAQNLANLKKLIA